LKTTNKRASAGWLSRGTTLRALIVWAVRAGPATQQSGQVAGSGTSAQVSRPFEKTAHSPRPLNSFVRRGGCFEDGDGSGRAACLGNRRGCYVADPASAVKMAFNVGPRFNFPILASKVSAIRPCSAWHCRRCVRSSIRSRKSRCPARQRCSSTTLLPPAAWWIAAVRLPQTYEALGRRIQSSFASSPISAGACARAMRLAG